MESARQEGGDTSSTRTLDDGWGNGVRFPATSPAAEKSNGRDVSVAHSNGNGRVQDCHSPLDNASGESSADSQLAKKKKRRSRMLDELAFSSPGPAFLSATTSANGTPEIDSAPDTDPDTSSVSRTRPRRSRVSQGAPGRKVSAAIASGLNAPAEAGPSTLRHSPFPSRGMEASASASPTNRVDLHRSLSPQSQRGSAAPPIRPSPKGKERSIEPDASPQSRATCSPERRGTRLRRPSMRMRYDEGLDGDGSGHARSASQSKSSKPLQNAKDRHKGDTSANDGSVASNDRLGELLRKKRGIIDRIYSDHDLLVRELFHLRKFVTMVGYDPEIARQDHSDVFERFRMEHDLAASVGSSASRRTTRHDITARRGHLSLPSLQAASSVELPSKRPQQQRISSAKRAVEAENHPAPSSEEHKRAKRALLAEKEIDKRKRNLDSNGRGTESVDANVRSSDDEELGTLDGTRKKSKVAKGRQKPQTDSEIILREPVAVERIDGIPRIRLLEPTNLPRPPKHGSSLSNYLASFYTSGYFIGSNNNELEVISLDEMRSREDRDAGLYRRIDELRSQGLLQSQEEALKRNAQGKAREPSRQVTAWDSLLSQVNARASRHRAEVRAKVALSKRVARMVQEHWDEKLGQGEKYRRAEERRVRQLAKWTVREVRKQWKLAVNVIRAQRQAREKAERDRVGRQQLNSILEQSTQMLGRQQRALHDLSEQELVDSDEEESMTESGSDESSATGESVGSDDEQGSMAGMSVDEDSAANAKSTKSLDAGKQPDAAIDRLNGASEALEEAADLQHHSIEVVSSIDEADMTPDAAVTSRLIPVQRNGILHSNGASGQIKTENGIKDHLRPVRTTRRLDPALLKKAAQERSTKHDVEDDDVDFDADDDARSAEDDVLAREMWEDDVTDSEDEDSLAAEAEMPIEELLKKYGYTNGDATDDRLDDNDAEFEKDDDESEDEASSEQGIEVNGAVSELSDVETSHLGDTSVLSQRRSRSQTAASTPAVDRQVVKIKPPFLLRGTLRPYQQIGFEWLVNLYNHSSNGILADEMGLGKTIQTIALLGHLACDKGIWGPHLVVAPTSVMLNWEVEFKKFFPGFKVLSYYGSQRERKEKRKGWNTENSFNICITSYQLVLADQHILRRKPWQYLILDEAHHIKNFRSQRWQTLLGFNSQRRLLLTGTPLQNNLMDLWSLMYFLMPNGVTSAEGVVSSGFASMKEFQQWFSNPLDKAVESAGVHAASEEMDSETRSMVSKLHTLLRPYLLRRLKSEVERELPNKYEHVIKCRLSKRQQFLYNDFMSRAKTRESLASGNYLSIINCLMQLRKVCNHPDLFEERPILTSFAMQRSAVADYEVKENIVRKRIGHGLGIFEKVNLDVLDLRLNVADKQHLTPIRTRSLRHLDASAKLPHAKEILLEPPAVDTWSIEGFQHTIAQAKRAEAASRWKHTANLNRLRCNAEVLTLADTQSLALLRTAASHDSLLPFSLVSSNTRTFMNRCDSVHRCILSLNDRRSQAQPFVDRFAFVPPRAVARDMPQWALPELTYESAPAELLETDFDTLHAPAVKLQIAFPDASLLQYDCGKLQALATLMDRCKAGGHRILIFTQMTKVLDILEKWLNFNGFNYLRLDGSTKIEDRQALTERFNRDERIRAFILSTRSGGLGINLTGADTVLFWDLDWNFQIEAQCMDRAHRIGQTRDVHIYRFVSEHTIEENMLKKSQEKRLLDAMVIQDGQFTTEGLNKMSWIESMFDEGGRTIAGVRVGGGEGKEGSSDATSDVQSRRITELPANDRSIEQAMDAAEDEEDARAAKTARAELDVVDEDFVEEGDQQSKTSVQADGEGSVTPAPIADGSKGVRQADIPSDEVNDEEGGTVDDYMLRRVDEDWDYFATL